MFDNYILDARQTFTQYLLHLLAARDPAQLRYGNNGPKLNKQFSQMRRWRQRRDHVGERGSQAARNFTTFCIPPLRTGRRTGGNI